MTTGADTFDDANWLFESAETESRYRSSASRAYFAVFQHLTNSAAVNYSSVNTGEDHRRLIDHFKNSAESNLRRLGYNRLPRLRAIRNHADYDLAREFPRAIAQEMLEDASEILHGV